MQGSRGLMGRKEGTERQEEEGGGKERKEGRTEDAVRESRILQ